MNSKQIFCWFVLVAVVGFFMIKLSLSSKPVVDVQPPAQQAQSNTPWRALGDPDAWTNAPMGIAITSIVSQRDGLQVSFATDLPPPYRVGIHLPQHADFVRARPVAYTDAWTTNAFVRADLSDVPVFVQVYKVAKRIVPEPFRTLTPGEWSQYVAFERRHPKEVREIAYRYNNPKRMDAGAIAPANMYIVSDGTWLGFIRTNATELTYCIDMVKPTSPGASSCITNDVSLKLRNRNPKIGKGFRILAFPDRKPMQFMAQCAYSAETNMSQEVLIRRGYKSHASNGEWKQSKDWEHDGLLVPCRDKEPYQIYTDED